MQKENEELREQLASIPTREASDITDPDYSQIRDRVLRSWKVAKRAESKERIRQALDKFIQELPQTRLEASDAVEDAQNMGVRLRRLVALMRKHPLNSMTVQDFKKQIGWDELTAKQVVEMALAAELIVEVEVVSPQGYIFAFRLK